MEKFVRVCSKTGKGMNEGFIVNDGDFYFKEESDLLDWLREQDFITAEGEEANKFSNEDLKEWAFNDEIYYWTKWEIEAETEYYNENGKLL